MDIGSREKFIWWLNKLPEKWLSMNEIQGGCNELHENYRLRGGIRATEFIIAARYIIFKLNPQCLTNNHNSENSF